jgi:hypothetical protein
LQQSRPRKRKRFSAKGRSCQFQASADVRAGADEGAILKAAAQICRNRDNHDAAFVIDKITSKTIQPEKVKQLRRSISGKDVPVTKISPEEELSQVFDNGTTKRAYLNNRKKYNRHGVKISPSWHALKKSKLKCRPPGAQFSAKVAQTPLQSILDHTVDRIFEDENNKAKLKIITDEQDDDELVILDMYCKIGMDGSAGYGITKPKPKASGDSTQVVVNEKVDDNRLFVTLMVPIQIRVHEEHVNANPEVIYHNLLCNSAITCRPVRLAHEKETAGNIFIYKLL